jgi:tryptophan synthase alpha chain
MSQRIENTFARLKDENRAALIPFIMGYDPDAATTAAVLDVLPASGADLIEIGMPFSDPMADGPIIQAAGTRALAAGATVAGILDLVRVFRAKHPHVPIILMGYYNPVYRYGADINSARMPPKPASTALSWWTCHRRKSMK